MKNRLSVKAVKSLLILAVVLIISTCFAVGMQYYTESMEQVRLSSYSYAKAASDFIDGDRVLKYLDTGVKDEYYEQILAYLNATQKTNAVLYYSVYLPTEEDLIYIWDARGSTIACCQLIMLYSIDAAGHNS